MLEVVMLLNVLLILIVLSSKMIIANVSKFSLYEIKEDIFYLNDYEYELLREVEDLIKNNEEVFDFIRSYKDDLNIKYEHIFSKDEKLKFIIYESKLYLKESLPGKVESIREVDVAFIDSDKGEVEIIFRPKLYKMFYMV